MYKRKKKKSSVIPPKANICINRLTNSSQIYTDGCFLTSLPLKLAQQYRACFLPAVCEIVLAFEVEYSHISVLGRT